ncbi:hypothetical protein [Streptomyces sp. NPDC048527]|uniref:hypothetical protein n=1 Tax=Streptomyces sp. NPDC048527 TaxID=3365568 RepID=UPI00371B4782
MSAPSPRGRVYRRCGCHGEGGRQLGPHRPRLASDPDHGSWALAVDALTGPDGRRRTGRRRGFASRTEVETTLARVRESLPPGLRPDPTETLVGYLLE